MEDHQEHGAPDGLLYTDPGAADDQSKIRDRGKCKYLLSVILCDGHHTCHDKGQSADTGYNDPGQIALQGRRDADEQMNAVYERMEERLKGIVGTKVAISRGKGNKGKIEIEYYSQEELERILELFETIK